VEVKHSTKRLMNIRNNIISEGESDEIVQKKYTNIRKIVGEYRGWTVTITN